MCYLEFIQFYLNFFTFSNFKQFNFFYLDCTLKTKKWQLKHSTYSNIYLVIQVKCLEIFTTLYLKLKNIIRYENGDIV